VIVASALLALAALWLSGMARLPQLLAALLVLVSAGGELLGSRPGSRSCISRLQITADGCLRVGVGPFGPPVYAKILHFWIAGGWLAGLAVRLGDGRRARAILLRHQLAPDEWRRLVVCLRFARGPG
jgi:hypothetical protein